jgi:hypothetical protein
MSKRRVLGFKPKLRPEWRGQDGQRKEFSKEHENATQSLEHHYGISEPLVAGDSVQRCALHRR